MKPNQRDHILQWLVIIIFIEVFLLLCPIWVWVKLALIGFTFIINFMLRLARKYPGEDEPLIVDLLTAGVAFLLIIPFIFIKNPNLLLILLILSPFVILIPHFIYIFKNKKIKQPGIRNIIKKDF